MERKFKKGDRVRIQKTEETMNTPEDFGFITSVLTDEDGDLRYSILLDKSQIKIIVPAFVLEPIDLTTAFLTELQALMRRYNVCININLCEGNMNFPEVCMDIHIGNGNVQTGVCYSDILNKTLTPDNIFDYEK